MEPVKGKIEPYYSVGSQPFNETQGLTDRVLPHLVKLDGTVLDRVLNQYDKAVESTGFRIKIDLSHHTRRER
jgi:hypothetical protein